MPRMITAQLLLGNNQSGNYRPVYLSADFPPMGIKETRIERLQELIKKRFDGVKLRLAVALEMKPPQLHRWLSGEQGMHEESARQIEIKLGLPPHWLDGADGSTLLLTPFEEALIQNLRHLPQSEQESHAAEIYRRATFWISMAEGIVPPHKPEPTEQ